MSAQSISEVDFFAAPQYYPGLVLEGSPEERGWIYGAIFADKIKTNVERHLARPDLPSLVGCAHLLNGVYIDSFRQTFPDGMDELVGISKGSNVSLINLLYLNVRDDINAIAHHLRRPAPNAPITGPQLPEETTSAYFSDQATYNTSPMLAQSRVASKQIVDENLMSPSILMVVEAGMISGSGINSSGIAVTSNCLLSKADFVPVRSGGAYLPVTMMERHILEQFDTVDAFAAAREFPVHASKHVSIADWYGTHVSLEITPGENWFQHFGGLRNRPGVLLHTNHFQSFEHWQKRGAVGDAYTETKSQGRLSRLKGLIAALNPVSQISANKVTAMFANHDGDSERLCQHEKEGQNDITVSFVMLNPFDRTVSICKGPPCHGSTIRLKLDGPPLVREDAEPQRPAIRTYHITPQDQSRGIKRPAGGADFLHADGRGWVSCDTPIPSIETATAAGDHFRGAWEQARGAKRLKTIPEDTEESEDGLAGSSVPLMRVVTTPVSDFGEGGRKDEEGAGARKKKL
ncbi:hypothetical protein N0V88_002473 [Collariella sp. IMI 366227]|nr:hypothetical protein N0V88_002473 [Collariella sp. IMI 366227]